jgi:S-adenosylmethionine/arginine decarboxylase-like enzyme
VTTRPTNDTAPALDPTHPGYVPWGQETTIDLHGCDPTVVADGATVAAFLAAVVPAVGMTPYGERRVDRFGDPAVGLQGWSGDQRIQTSLVSVHCDEVGHRVFINFFSCRPFNSVTAASMAVEHFGGRPHVRITRR